MRSLEQTEEYRLGRRGEVVIYSYLVEHGFTAFDQAGTARGTAPMLNSAHGNMVAPDALMIGRYPLFAEFKTKTAEFLWGGGSREVREAGHRIMPAGPAHGIPTRAWLDYCEANLRLPVVLWFLCKATGRVHAGSLDELGMPYSSWNPAYDMVNWPIALMWPIVEFNAQRLAQVLDKNSVPQVMPSVADRQQGLAFLQPRQLEFDAFHTDFLTRREAEWNRRAT